MTAPSSSERSFFREYFIFRLSAQKVGLIMCSVWWYFPGARTICMII